MEELGKTIWKQYATDAGQYQTIDSVAGNIITGKTPSTKKPEYYGGVYPFVTIPDMHSSVWLCSTDRALSDLGNESQPKKLVPAGSVLVSCIATIGLVGLTAYPSHFNQQINDVVPNRSGEEYYLYYALSAIKSKLLGIGATGSATLNVNKAAFSSIEIPWPSSQQMRDYLHRVTPVFEAMKTRTIESIKLEQIRDALLPKLLSGQIDVSKVAVQ